MKVRAYFLVHHIQFIDYGIVLIDLISYQSHKHN